jgi:hypothetical protein
MRPSDFRTVELEDLRNAKPLPTSNKPTDRDHKSNNWNIARAAAPRLCNQMAAGSGLRGT